MSGGRPEAVSIPGPVVDLARRLAGEERGLPAYAYDLAELRQHAASIRTALPPGVELLYAVKANPDARILAALAPLVDGFEVSSGGELEHCSAVVPGARLLFGGPGKTPAELALAAAAGIHRVHVESPHELRVLAAVAPPGRRLDVLLRVNLPVAPRGAALAMGGVPTPFGMDEAALEACVPILTGSPRLRVRGLHAHTGSGLEAAAALEGAREVTAFARRWGARNGLPIREIDIGGGMQVDYQEPASRFHWAAFGAGLSGLARDGEILRIEPGRSVTAYCGWYLARVLDVKRTHGEAFAVLQGGTHHLRTPAARGHDQPFAVVPVEGWPWSGSEAVGEPVTIAGQLCTPKDVLARRVEVERLRTGDVLAFALAGAYAWNISHLEFLMHGRPAFHYLDGQLTKQTGRVKTEDGRGNG